MMRAPLAVVIAVGLVPVAVVGMSAALWHLIAPPAVRLPRTPAPDTRAATVSAVSVSSPPAAVDTARLRSDHPDMTQADIADRLGISARTVRRHLAAANGHPKDL